MSREIGPSYKEVLLLPPCLEDWVPADHPARFIRELIDSLDLRGLGFCHRQAKDGRPSYATDMLVKVWVYGFFQRIRSSRTLERACREHMSLIWLTGNHAPDHNTLWRFWRANREPLRGLFKQGLKVAAKAKLVGMVLHAVDGTKIAANASRRRAWHRDELEKLLRRVDAVVDEAVKGIESAQGSEEGEYRLPEELGNTKELRGRITEALAELERLDRDHLNPNDPEARMMKCEGRTVFAYNAQAVVDGDSGLVVAQDVVNDEADYQQLVPMIKQVEENLEGTAKETVVDCGYASPAALAEAQGSGTDVVAAMSTALAPGDAKPFHSSNFMYDSTKDACICPLGKELEYERVKRSKRAAYPVRVFRCRCFRECPMKDQCSRDRRGRMVEIGPHHGVVQRQRDKLKDPAKRASLRQRQVIVEPVFGIIKANDGFRRWLARGLENVRTQWAMLCLAVNLRKLYHHWATGSLVLA